MRAGRARRNAPRTSGGTPTSGRSEASTPAFRAAVSGATHTSSAIRTNSAVSTPNTAVSGSPGTWSSTSPEISPPAASPASGVTEFAMAPIPGRLTGSRSTTAADIEDMSSPAPNPWTTRAVISTPTLSACQKAAMLPASTSSPAAITGRRPRWSESEPVSSRVTSIATA